MVLFDWNWNKRAKIILNNSLKGWWIWIMIICLLFVKPWNWIYITRQRDGDGGAWVTEKQGSIGGMKKQK